MIVRELNNPCPQCHGIDFQIPDEIHGFQTWVCTNCGHEMWVHSNLAIPSGPIAKRALYKGTLQVQNKSDAIKSFLKLKPLLKNCIHFRLSSLERQYHDHEPVWDLGTFLDVEVERLKPLCEQFGIAIEFNEIAGT